MADDWDFYLCRIDDSLSSIFLNLALRDGAPDPHRPHLLWIRVPMRSPRPDGLSSAEEAEQLGRVEDALGAALLARLDAVFAGRITGAGRREFYYYAPRAADFRERATAVFRDFPGYEPLIGDKHDPEWALYLELLFPNVRQLQQIRNRQVVAALAEAGDVASTPRPITHWVYFAESADRATAASTLAAAGFDVTLHDAVTGEAARPYPLRVERVDRADQAAVDEAVFQVMDAIEGMDAEYDGWESPVEEAT